MLIGDISSRFNFYEVWFYLNSVFLYELFCTNYDYKYSFSDNNRKILFFYY